MRDGRGSITRCDRDRRRKGRKTTLLEKRARRTPQKINFIVMYAGTKQRGKKKKKNHNTPERAVSRMNGRGGKASLG